MTRKTYEFDGGELLTGIGAAWFVSYCYYNNIDPTHQNWDKVKTKRNRISKYDNSIKYHKGWLLEIPSMSDEKLGQNTFGLTGAQVKEMARELLKVLP